MWVTWCLDPDADTMPHFHHIPNYLTHWLNRDKKAIESIKAAIQNPKNAKFPLIECEFPPLESLNKLGDGSLRSANLVDDVSESVSWLHTIHTIFSFRAHGTLLIWIDCLSSGKSRLCSKTWSLLGSFASHGTESSNPAQLLGNGIFCPKVNFNLQGKDNQFTARWNSTRFNTWWRMYFGISILKARLSSGRENRFEWPSEGGRHCQWVCQGKHGNAWNFMNSFYIAMF